MAQAPPPSNAENPRKRFGGPTSASNGGPTAGPSTPRLANAVPAEILEDAQLNAAIAAILPPNYSFEIHKTIHHIRKNGSTCVALQMPEGLTLWATGISDIIERFTDATTVIMGDVTYGACCVDDYTAMALGCDMLVHYGHSCLVPVDQTAIKTLYVFVEISIDPAHLAATVRANFPNDRDEFRARILGGSQNVKGQRDVADESTGRPQIQIGLDAEEGSSVSGEGRSETDPQSATVAKSTHLALVGTVQFINAIHGLKEALEQEQYRLADGTVVNTPQEDRLMITAGSSGEAVEHIAQASKVKQWHSGQYRVTVPQVKPLSPGEILGCTSPKLTNQDVDAIIYIGDGRFHLESIMIGNPRIPAFRYDPYTKRFVRELYDHAEMRKMRGQAVREASQSVGIMELDPERLSSDAATVKESSISTEVKTETSDRTKPSGWGVVLGTLGRQGSLKVLESLTSSLTQHVPAIPYVPILLSELSPQKLSLFGPHLATFIQSSCPRLSIDWGSAFPKPLLSPYEAAVSVGKVKGWQEDVDGLGMSRTPANAAPSLNGAADASLVLEGDYPMDFYSDNSLGPWTPRHGMGVRKRTGAGAGSNRALLRRGGAAAAAARLRTAAVAESGASQTNVTPA